MTVRLTEEEVQELKRQYERLQHDLNCEDEDKIRDIIVAALPKLLAERREREAQLSEQTDIINAYSSREAHLRPELAQADTRAEAERAEKNEHRQRMRAEAKLARVALAREKIAAELASSDHDSRGAWDYALDLIDEALADPPRTAGGTDGTC